jgi:hypothetical protein
MVDLSNYIPDLLHSDPVETLIIIKSGCSFEEVRTLAMQNRAIHPDEPVVWMKVNNAYTLSRVVKS